MLTKVNTALVVVLLKGLILRLKQNDSTKDEAVKILEELICIINNHAKT